MFPTQRTAPTLYFLVCPRAPLCLATAVHTAPNPPSSCLRASALSCSLLSLSLSLLALFWLSLLSGPVFFAGCWCFFVARLAVRLFLCISRFCFGPMTSFGLVFFFFFLGFVVMTWFLCVCGCFSGFLWVFGFLARHVVLPGVLARDPTHSHQRFFGSAYLGVTGSFGVFLNPTNNVATSHTSPREANGLTHQQTNSVTPCFTLARVVTILTELCLRVCCLYLTDMTPHRAPQRRVANLAFFR